MGTKNHRLFLIVRKNEMLQFSTLGTVEQFIKAPLITKINTDNNKITIIFKI